ncbi:hypothetical protein ACFSSC_05235 [Corynebacterium mendelii]|uniref:Uncharacterized protein n=1 Tax=Corynebacterium mendelii TaxID=2765362 RepID=A0A939DY99_9CORY|nr:hypothetical protein [Corynebacterium mendelii]MBN9643198.1 hypothetical protein [Corynebacterium mendelii]
MLITRTYHPHAPRNRQVAALFLTDRNLAVRATGVRYPGGEADIIAEDTDGTVVAACVVGGWRRTTASSAPVTRGRLKLLATAAKRFTAHRSRAVIRLDALTVTPADTGDAGACPRHHPGDDHGRHRREEIVETPGGQRFVVTWFKGVGRARN